MESSFYSLEINCLLSTRWCPIPIHTAVSASENVQKNSKRCDVEGNPQNLVQSDLVVMCWLQLTVPEKEVWGLAGEEGDVPFG